MCSMSWIVPVRLFAGSASALRIDAGRTLAAAAAPSEDAAKRRKSRRLFDMRGIRAMEQLAAHRADARNRATRFAHAVRSAACEPTRSSWRSVVSCDDVVMETALRFFDAPGNCESAQPFMKSTCRQPIRRPDIAAMRCSPTDFGGRLLLRLDGAASNRGLCTPLRL